MKQIKIPKKLVVFNDIAGFGHCSSAVALPVISVLGVQACLAPTALFSNHTGFPTWHFDDYTANLPGYLKAWEQLKIDFDGIYAGFLGSEHQIRTVELFIENHPSCHVTIDPVLGDHGRLYSTVTRAQCEKMKLLIRRADLITPNITEACLLTGTPFKEKGWSEDELLSLAEHLSAMGPKKGVITGILKNHHLLNCYYETDSSGFYTGFCESPVAGTSRPGTGDIFASILAADSLNGISLKKSVQKASGFIASCIAGSDALNIPVQEGVCFENYLDLLLG